VADNDNTQKAPENGEVEQKPSSGRRFIVIAVVLLLVLGAGFWYWRSTFSEDTDDAQVDGDIFQISSRIAGQVTHVYVQDNKPVTQGELLL
jgi:membrane fusion protein (multidrug efflux system)